MKNERRIKILQYLGIFVLALLALKYINDLFSTQVEVLFYAINIIVLPFSIALFISYLLSPLMNLLENRVKIKSRLVIVLIVFFIMILVISAFGYFVGKIIYEQAVVFIDRDWANIITFVEGYIEDNDTFAMFYDWVNQFITFDNASPILINIFNVFRSITSIVLITILVPDLPDSGGVEPARQAALDVERRVLEAFGSDMEIARVREGAEAHEQSEPAAAPEPAPGERAATGPAEPRRADPRRAAPGPAPQADEEGR